MCLAVPGKIIDITDDDSTTRRGKVSFGGVVKEINLFFTPEAGIGDYVIVHAGFAISKLNEKEAEQILGYLVEFEREDSKNHLL